MNESERKAVMEDRKRQYDEWKRRCIKGITEGPDRDFHLWLSGVWYERRMRKYDCLFSIEDIRLLSTFIEQKYNELCRPGAMKLLNQSTREELIAHLLKIKERINHVMKGGGEFIVWRNIPSVKKLSNPEKSE